MRKMIAAALAVGMAAMTVTGCSSSKSESKETTKSTTEAAKDTEVESTSDQKTFTVGQCLPQKIMLYLQVGSLRFPVCFHIIFALVLLSDFGFQPLIWQASFLSEIHFHLFAHC